MIILYKGWYVVWLLKYIQNGCKEKNFSSIDQSIDDRKCAYDHWNIDFDYFECDIVMITQQ